ncbi:hypothetical protein RSOLAG22IIIB_11774 [Rhizoctonia solani]|uniref:Uncharacterized protein n=1 Tax=Rhizoctonia solani TaxID=456999 RepID=A0A0K6GAU6_9AGAM|nr:hypothetical protein RSOLAG22IIIB_11774 [Rhizoctonia solani]
MFATAHRHIPGQPAYTGHNRRTHTATGLSVSSSPYNDSHHPAQQAHHFTRSSHRASPVPGHSSTTDSAQSSPRRGAYSPASSSSGSSSSAKSVRWGESDSDEEGRISPGCYSVDSRKAHPKPVLKYRTLHVANAPSLFDKKTPKIALSASIDTVLCNIITCVKNFKCPSELNFTPNAAHASIIHQDGVEKDVSFIEQLQTFEALGKRLTEVPTHGDTQSRDKYDTTRATIGRAMPRMQEDFVDSSKLHPKPVLKCPGFNVANVPSLFDENMPKVAALAAMDGILRDLAKCLKNFKDPSELDFTANSASIMELAKVEKNKLFIDQLRRLERLAKRLDEIPTHDDALLMGTHNIAGMAIKRALFRMQEVQNKLGAKFIRSALDELAAEVRIRVGGFVYPLDLGFSKTSEDGILLQTERNKLFIHQLHVLCLFMGRLNNIPQYNDEKLERKHRVIGDDIGQNLDRMKEHQLGLYRRQLMEADQYR